MYTFQDFQHDCSEGVAYGVQTAIKHHLNSRELRIAKTADLYDRQRNKTIMEYCKILYSNGRYSADAEATNNKLCSNFFNRLNTQRVTYSLGNGITFSGDGVKEKLGIDFDTRMKNAGYLSCIHGLSFLFWNLDHLHVFKYTEFAPLWDEDTGALRAGVRYWQVDPDKPMIAVLYEEDGFTKFKGNKSGTELTVIEEKRSYRLTLRQAAADPEPEIIGEENYGSLPIVPLYGNRLQQSTLVGMQSKIDAFDLIQSGFANDLTDCAEIYWLVSNAGGMSDKELISFRDRLKNHRIANVDNADDVSITPYTQEIPTTARQTFLTEIRNSIYEDFGALDVHAVAAGATNDHIDAAYQPMDENADDFEYQIIEAVQQILALQGIEDTPLFKRNRVSNQMEQVEMVVQTVNIIGEEAAIRHLPFITPEEADEILKTNAADDLGRFGGESITE